MFIVEVSKVKKVSFRILKGLAYFNVFLFLMALAGNASLAAQGQWTWLAGLYMCINFACAWVSWRIYESEKQRVRKEI